MREVNFEDYVLLTVNTALNPEFMRAFEFLVKGETELPQEFCNALVSQMAKSSGHTPDDMLMEFFKKDAGCCPLRQLQRFHSPCETTASKASGFDESGVCCKKQH